MQARDTAETAAANGKPYEPFTESERNAMRAYLQRTEVRLSTLHRVAVTFISGAGLLLLFPTFFKEEIIVIIRVFLANIGDRFPALGAAEPILFGAMFLFVIYPFLLSLSIPIYALYLLLKDIIHFYFSIYTPGFATNVFTPSFALSGITFSPDESENVKRRVFEYQYRADAVNFAIPFSAEKRDEYFNETIANTGGEIIPRSRRPEALEKYGITPTDEEHRRRIEHLNTALGLSRTIDRNLAHEVATQEVSVARHILYLRRMVLRYMKTLLMFIWTTIVSFVMLPFLQDDTMPTFMVFSIGFLIWSLLAMPIMRTPVQWIYRHKKGNWDRTHIDRQMTVLERKVSRLVYVAIFTSAVALAISLVAYAG
jgi:hypothetical protein